MANYSRDPPSSGNKNDYTCRADYADTLISQQVTPLLTAGVEMFSECVSIVRPNMGYLILTDCLISLSIYLSLFHYCVTTLQVSTYVLLLSYISRNAADLLTQIYFD